MIPADAPKPNYAIECQSLAAAQKTFPRLKIPQSQVLQQTLKQLETAFVNMSELGFSVSTAS
nr:hypothetical protein [Arthrospira sp. PLM2.Bin9]